MRYRDLGEVPRRLPKAGVLVHNWVHAQWEDQRPGRNGFRVMDGAEAEDGPAALSVRLVGPAALSDYRVGDSGLAAGRDRQAVRGVDPRRGCGPAKAQGATYPRGAVGALCVARALRPLRCLEPRQERRP